MKSLNRVLACILLIAMLLTMLPVDGLNVVNADSGITQGNTNSIGGGGLSNPNGGGVVVSSVDGSYNPTFRVSINRHESVYNNGTPEVKEAMIEKFKYKYPHIDTYRESLLFEAYDVPMGVNKGSAYYDASSKTINWSTVGEKRNIIVKLKSSPSDGVRLNKVKIKLLNEDGYGTPEKPISSLSGGAWQRYLDDISYEEAILLWSYILGENSSGYHVDDRIDEVISIYVNEQPDLSKLETWKREDIAVGYVGVLMSLYKIAQVQNVDNTLGSIVGNYYIAIEEYLSNVNTKEKPVGIIIDTAIPMVLRNISSEGAVYLHIPSIDYVEYTALIPEDASIQSKDGEQFVKNNIGKYSGIYAYGKAGIKGVTRNQLIAGASESLEDIPLEETKYGDGPVTRIADYAPYETGKVRTDHQIELLKNPFCWGGTVPGWNRERLLVGRGWAESFDFSSSSVDAGFMEMMDFYSDGTTDIDGFLITSYHIMEDEPKIYYTVASSLNKMRENQCDTTTYPGVANQITFVVKAGSGAISVLEARMKNGETDVTIDIKGNVMRETYVNGNLTEDGKKKEIVTLSNELKEVRTGEELLSFLKGAPQVLHDTTIFTDEFERDVAGGKIVTYKYYIENLEVKIGTTAYKYGWEQICLQEYGVYMNYAEHSMSAFRIGGEPVEDIVIPKPSSITDLSIDNPSINEVESTLINRYDVCTGGNNYAEVKSNTPNEEKYEVMAGIPSTEEIYFSAGGSEFRLALVLQYWMNEKGVDRTYRSHYSGTSCEFKKGDQAKDYTVPSPTGATSSNLKVNGHKGGKVYAEWSYTVKNTSVHSGLQGYNAGKAGSPCAGNGFDPGNPGDITWTDEWTADVYNDAVQNAKDWQQAVNDFIVSYTSASDKKTREWHEWNASLTGNIWGDSISTTEWSSYTKTMGQYGKGSGYDAGCGHSGCTIEWDSPPVAPDKDGKGGSPGVPHIHKHSCGSFTPATKTTVTKTGDKSFRIRVEATLPAHVVCGPCCEHELKAIEDTWKQGIVYDYVKISQIRLYKIDQASVTGMTELTGTDEIFANIKSGDPTYFLNIAQLNAKADPIQPDSSEISNLGHRNTIFSGKNRAEAQSSKYGRLRYSLDPTKHDVVVWDEGVRSNKCDGLGKTKSVNVKPAGGNGHVDQFWATGTLYTNGTYANDYNHHMPRPGVSNKSDYSDRADDIDKNTIEWKKFDERRRTKNVATVISDFLILQTSGGDQSIFYFHKQTEPTEAQEHFQKMKATEEEMFTENINSIFNKAVTECIGGKAVTTAPLKYGIDFINIGGYNGNYKDVTKGSGADGKYAPYNYLTEKKLTVNGYKVATFVDADPANTIKRPARTGQFLMYEDEIQIKPTASNKIYTPNQPKVFYKQVIGYFTNDLDRLDTTGKRVAPLFNLDIGLESGKQSAENLVKWGDSVGLQYNTTYSSTIKDGINSVLVYTPVSCEDATILPLKGIDFNGDGVIDDDRDQRADGVEVVDLNAQINKFKICPLDPGLCEFRHLNCKYLQDTKLAEFDFEPTFVTENTDGVTKSIVVRQFDGVDDYIEIPSNNSLKLNNFTLEGWVKVNSLEDREQYLAWKYTGGATYATSYGIRLNNTNKWYSRITVGGTQYSVESKRTALEKRWYHVATTYDGSNLNLYVDGVLEASTPVSGSPDFGSFPMTIGKRERDSGVYDGFLNGDIYDVRLWNKAKTAQDIQDAMYETISSTESNLVGLWLLNDTTNIAKDSKNNLDGLIVGPNSIKYNRGPSSKKNTYQSGGKWVTTNKVTGIEYTLPTGFTIGTGKVGNGNHLNAFGQRWSIPFSDLGITNDKSNRVSVSMDFFMNANAPNKSMLVSFWGYDFWVNPNDGATLGVFNTGAGFEGLKGAATVAGNGRNKKVHLDLVFGFNNVMDCSATIDGLPASITVKKTAPVWETIGGIRKLVNKVSTVTSIKDAPDNITKELIGNTINIGGWGANDNYPANFYIDNLEIWLKGGTHEHNSSCYTNVKIHETSKIHVHDENCYVNEDMYTTCDGKLNANYQLRDDFVGGTLSEVKNFSYTSSVQTFIAPATGEYTLEVWGAEGGTSGYGGKGGYSKGTVTLNKGEVLRIYVGGQGGYNGGGSGNQSKDSGGGGTDIRVGGTALGDRIIVAGGGGGYGGNSSRLGGDGGGTTGSDGLGSGSGGTLRQGGKGATQSSGGSGGPGVSKGGSGKLGQGGSQTAGSTSSAGGGGGGGYYGGGAGGNDYPNYDDRDDGAGGGGSGYIGGVTSGTMSNGSRSGNGYAKISYNITKTPQGTSGLDYPNGDYTKPTKHKHTTACGLVKKDTLQCTGELNTISDFNNHKHTSECLTTAVTLPTVTFNYTGDAQSYTVPADGYYTLKAWGASGGGGLSQQLGSHKGLGGYTEGKVYLKKGEKIYVYVGGEGKLSTALNTGGGWNGGGHGGANGFGGGGATDFRLSRGYTFDEVNSLYSRIMVSGGGGGADNLGGGLGTADDGSGGAGGGLIAGNARLAGSLITGKISAGEHTANTTNGGGLGQGGSQVGGYRFGKGESVTRATDTGGAGGGYWGGTVTNHNNGGAGGGSSYISGYAGANSVDMYGVHTGNVKHYSGKLFTNTVMQQGVNNGNGKAMIIPETVPASTLLTDIINGDIPLNEMNDYLGEELMGKLWGTEKLMFTWSNWTSSNMKGIVPVGTTLTPISGNLRVVQHTNTWEMKVPVSIPKGLISRIEVTFDNKTSATEIGIAGHTTINSAPLNAQISYTPVLANTNNQTVTIIPKDNWAENINALWFNLVNGRLLSGSMTIKSIKLYGYGTAVSGTGEVQTVTIKTPKQTTETTTVPKYMKKTTVTRYTNGVAGTPSSTEVEITAAQMGSTTTTDTTVSSKTLVVASGKTWNYDFTGGVQTFKPPATGNYRLEVWGAQGNSNSYTAAGGQGGKAQGEINLTSAKTLNIYVGGQNGWNGGGTGGTGANKGANGGGATDIRIDGTANGNRVIVAGGGGGGGAYSNGGSPSNRTSDAGGPGGYAHGGSGTYGGSNRNYNGKGGSAATTSAGGSGGARGTASSSSSSDGTYYQAGGGGGGGGYYGGGGGGSGGYWGNGYSAAGQAGSTGTLGQGGSGGNSTYTSGRSGWYSYAAGGGGGGSSWTGSLTNATTTANQKSGDGRAVITSLQDVYSGDDVFDRTEISYYETTKTTSTPKTVVKETTQITFDPLKINFAATKNDFTNPGSFTFKAPTKGWYSFEGWGASGSYPDSSAVSGKGGYTYGEIYLNKDETVYVYVGERGSGNSESHPVYTFNGGGYSGHAGSSTNHASIGGRGGGATDFRLNSGSWDNVTGLRSRIMVAGGGGGKGCAFSPLIHGHAGGAVGRDTLNGHATYYGYVAKGGTQTSSPVGHRNGNAVSSNYSKAGSFGKGGIEAQCGGGGGGGYYGGGSTYTAGGAGGSSFISGMAGMNAVNSNGTHRGNPTHYSGKVFRNPLMRAGDEVMPTPTGGTQVGHSGNGFARITFIPEKPEGEPIRQTILDNVDLIPSYLPNGEWNPIFLCKGIPYNEHICTDNCKTYTILKCTEPHHYGEHYDSSNRICWDACGNDDNHKLVKDEIEIGAGVFVKNARFLQIDHEFTVYFPNNGDFKGAGDGAGALGLSTPQSQTGYGYTNNMDTTQWTREKRVKFPFNVIYKGEMYVAGNWIELEVREEYFDFYLVLANYEASNAPVEFEVEAINAGVDKQKSLQYRASLATTYANALTNFKTSLEPKFIAHLISGYKANDETASIQGYKGYFVWKQGQETSVLTKAKNDIKSYIWRDFNGGTGVANTNDGTKDLNSINERAKPITTNDNRNRPSNVLRSSSLESLHGGYKYFYLDVVGRIGNFAIVDTEDYRFSNFFKLPKTDPAEWLVEGFIHKVEEQVQNNYLGDMWDIRGNKISTHTKWLNTYGTQTWMQGTFESGRNVNNPNIKTQILSGGVNNIEQLKKEQLRFGYDIYASISTIGDYQKGRVLVTPYYYALNLETGSIVPLDVFISKDGVYEPVNIFNNSTNGEYNKPVYDYNMNLDWTTESDRRNFLWSEQEYTETQRVAEFGKRDIYDYGPYNESNMPPVDYEPTYVRTENYKIPSGAYNYLGNAQSMLLNASHRTFIGSEESNGSAAENAKWDTDKNPGGKLSTVKYSAAAQRWHFKIGVPSSSVFVRHGMEPNEVNISEIMDNNKYAVISTISVVGIGGIWDVEYKQPWVSNIEVNGNNYDINASNLPPIVAIFASDKSSVQDVDIIKTH